HRRFIDANRPAAEAFEDPAARPIYEAYHRAIRRFVDEIRGNYGERAILFDIHGQAQDPDMIHRGTQDHRTVRHLLRAHHDAALSGPDSVFGRLAALGYKVFPPPDAPADARESRHFDGGYTVETYGSQHENGIDAIQ